MFFLLALFSFAGAAWNHEQKGKLESVALGEMKTTSYPTPFPTPPTSFPTRYPTVVGEDTLVSLYPTMAPTSDPTTGAPTSDPTTGAPVVGQTPSPTASPTQSPYYEYSFNVTTSSTSNLLVFMNDTFVELDPIIGSLDYTCYFNLVNGTMVVQPRATWPLALQSFLEVSGLVSPSADDVDDLTVVAEKTQIETLETKKETFKSNMAQKSFVLDEKEAAKPTLLRTRSPLPAPPTPFSQKATKSPTMRNVGMDAESKESNFPNNSDEITMGITIPVGILLLATLCCCCYMYSKKSGSADTINSISEEKTEDAGPEPVM